MFHLIGAGIAIMASLIIGSIFIGEKKENVKDKPQSIKVESPKNTISNNP